MIHYLYYLCGCQYRRPWSALLYSPRTEPMWGFSRTGLDSILHSSFNICYLCWQSSLFYSLRVLSSARRILDLGGPDRRSQIVVPLTTHLRDSKIEPTGNDGGTVYTLADVRCPLYLYTCCMKTRANPPMFAKIPAHLYSYLRGWQALKSISLTREERERPFHLANLQLL